MLQAQSGSPENSSVRIIYVDCGLSGDFQGLIHTPGSVHTMSEKRRGGPAFPGSS